MSKKSYVGVNGVAHNVKKMYIGVNGVARKVKKAYIGVNGVARLVYQSEWVPSWVQTTMPNTSWNSVCYGDGKFVAVADYGNIISAYTLA